MTCQPCLARDECGGPAGPSCVDEFARTIDRLSNSGCRISCGLTPETVGQRGQDRVCAECQGESA